MDNNNAVDFRYKQFTKFMGAAEDAGFIRQTPTQQVIRSSVDIDPTAIVAGDRVFIVDVGSGSPRNLMRFGVMPGSVERVFITHFHSDHIDALGELMLQRWVGGTHTSPLPVHGPNGISDVVNGLNAAYAQDATYRTAHHGPDIAPPTGHGGQGVR